MAATRIGPPTPPPGRPRPGDQAAPAAARSGPVVAPAFPPPDARALRALAAMADGDGLIAVSPRRLAAELDLTTVSARALLLTLVDAGALHEVGRRVYALAGSGAADDEPPPQPEPRTPPHDAVHEGTGSPLLW